MNQDLVWLDLCSGLGGASQPAKDRGWKVIRVDIDPRFKPDIVADVRALPLKPFHVDVLWASPPCETFTKTGLPESWARGWTVPSEDQVRDAVELVKCCRRAVGMFSPDWWIIENTRGSRAHLNHVLGPLRATVSGHVLWGRWPGLLPQTKQERWKLPPSPDRAALRAKIPYEIGAAICAAVERRQAEA